MSSKELPPLVLDSLGLGSRKAPYNYNNGGATITSTGTLVQSERLFTARPRYVPSAEGVSNYDKNQLYKESPFVRGQHAYIKLLTSTEQAFGYVSSTKNPRESGVEGSGKSTMSNLTGTGSIVAGMVQDNASAISAYDRFLLTNVSCQLSEKLQVTEVFGDGEVAYYFGRQPMMVNISGVLIDSPDNSWLTDWLRMYSGFLRGSQLAKNYELLKIVLPNMILIGSISSMDWSQEASNDVSIPFNFQFLAKQIEPVPATTMEVPNDALIDYLDFSKASEWVSQQNINSVKKQVAQLTNVVKNPLSTISDLGRVLDNYGSGLANQLRGVEAAVTNFADNNVLSRYLSSYASMFKSDSSVLDGVRLSIVSPIYGVLSSLTRLVTRTFGDINQIFNSVFTPVQNVLRDIKNIADKATALVDTLNSSIRGLGRNITRQITTTKNDFARAQKSLGRAAGAITSSPKTVLQSIQEMFKGGALGSSAAFLQSNPRASLSQSVGSGAGAGSTGVGYNSKIAMLTSAPIYSSKAGARL